MRPHVVHVVDTFGARSETFVYSLVTNHQQFAARVLCRQRVLADEFPFAGVDVVAEDWSRAHFERWWSLAIGSATGRTPWQRRVERMLRTSPPAIVHAHFGQVGVRILPAITRTGLPLVTSFYGYDAGGFANSAEGQRLLPALFTQGTLFVAEGPVMRQRLITLGAPADRVRVVPIAIDLSKYPAWAPDERRRIVLFVARFVEKKGLVDAIEAFAVAHQDDRNLVFRVIGDGPEASRARQRATALGLDAAIEWLGPLPHATVIGEMQRASVLIQPSLTAADGDSEGGAPTTLIEAQAIGVPIVATRHADIPNVAPEGVGIYLAAERDVPALAEGLTMLLREARGSDPTGVVARHDVRHVMPRLEQCYREALETRRTLTA